MIATLLAAAALATSPVPTPPAATPMRQVIMSESDLAFLGLFLDHYAGQGCEIHTAPGLDMCRSALRAMDVWRALQASTPVEPGKAGK